jgi:hypothetical protein
LGSTRKEFSKVVSEKRQSLKHILEFASLEIEVFDTGSSEVAKINACDHLKSTFLEHRIILLSAALPSRLQNPSGS